ncbi:hypothetical protein ACPCTO_35600 [Streptomyces olivoreticuli]
MAVLQEDDRLVDGPDVPLCGRPRDDRGPCGIVIEPVRSDSLAQRTRQGGEDTVDGDRTPPVGELGAREAGDVPVPEIIQFDLPERGDEVVP